jgi:hypothetical protein
MPSDDARNQVMQRLALAREFLGTQDPLEFILAWRTPSERYQSLYRNSHAPPQDESGAGGVSFSIFRVIA